MSVYGKEGRAYPTHLYEHDSDLKAKKVSLVNGLVPEKYDQIDLTYITSGNGTGEIGTVIYKKDSETVATLTLSYDADNKLSSVVKS